jgi:hypothetical protein
MRCGLPTIPTLAEFENGDILPRDWDGKGPLPKRDLFSKPTNAFKGTGARRWTMIAEGSYRSEGNVTLNEEELIQFLREQSKKGHPVILQPCMHNHVRVQHLTGPALAAIRMFTMRSPSGAPRYMSSYISLPLGNVTGSNTTFDVIRTSVEGATGKLGVAYDKKDLANVMEPVVTHPITGQRIEGFTLPDWNEAVELALQAHATLPDIALVGWDIGLTGDGPVIIEGNRTPGSDSDQVAHKRPWGATRIPSLLLDNIMHASES